jgi:hypothetical protein
MAKKNEPRLDWGMEAFSFPSELKEKAYRLPAIMGIELSAKLQKKYETAINLFIADRMQRAEPPRRKEINDLLKKLRKASKDFSKAIKSFGDPYLYRTLGSNGKEWPEVRDHALDAAKKIYNVANTAYLRAGLDKGGPSKDIALDGLIRRLVPIYCKAANKKPTSKHFRAFIETLLEILGFKYHSRESLMKRIQRVLSA